MAMPKLLPASKLLTHVPDIPSVGGHVLSEPLPVHILLHPGAPAPGELFPLI